MDSGYKNKKWSTIAPWCFLIFSLIVSFFVPGVGDRVSNFGIVKMIKDAYSFDYRATVMLFAFLIFVFLVMYGIDFLRSKFLGYSPPPNKTEEELRNALRSFGIILEAWRIYAVILGIIILIASFWGINIR